ncbi:DNA replication nuclease DNA2 [Hyphodiscus hymeniophilus]|uniref:DNA replication ATP-dependent helicase/nuclease n=1 Tax=Hyphodiscus hymeniophilus TaxID=353542 RepID=A0A9P6VLG9_9HELO|nr:DNA replication nuclease DNA2 [Hyphodiscus hymeniophilus]
MPLQKSFSDQNHSTKRPQWSRNRSFQSPRGATSNLPPRPLQDRPAVPVSTATKNKLSVFQFGGNPDSNSIAKQEVISLLSSDDKENAGTGYTRGQDAMPEVGNESSQGKLPELIKWDAPSTPAGRLALPDLIGMGDVKRAVQDISPEDRIEWDALRSSNSMTSKTRARKRARSSSPLASPPGQLAAFINSRAQLDPGSELWGRYSLNGSNAPTPQGQSVPALAHIMHTSSPQPEKERATPRSGSAFKRANSCGNQFPKRRRVGGSENDDVFTESVKIGPSKLSVLLEQVQEGFTQPVQHRQSPQTSAPTPATLNVPTKRRYQDFKDVLSTEQSRKGDTMAVPRLSSSPSEANKTPKKPQTSIHSNSSDYGEFDDDDLDVSLLDVCILSTEEPFSNPTREYPTVQRPPDPPSQPPASLEKYAQPRAAMKDSKSSDSSTLKDEFDDSDEEIFAADLENIVAKFDTQNTRHGKVLSAPRKVVGISKADSDDEFGDGGLDEGDFEAAEVAATQSLQQTANSFLPSTQRVRAIQRYLVTNVIEADYETTKGRMMKEKVLLLRAENQKTIKMVNLRGTWIETPVTTKAFVHVIGTFDRNGQCIIDDKNNMLILHPDHLISSTVVGDSFGCTRRAVLQDRVKATSESSAPLIYGTILHEIFQAAMLANRWDTQWLHELIENVATKHLEDLYVIKLQPEAIVKAGNGEKASMCVSKLLDVEEHVWSPMYGLKGNIDATVQVTMEDGRQRRVLTVPFEVKTGKNPSAAHRAQTALYNLLLSDRYDVEIAYGILYYMETSETIRIPAIRHELRHMIMQRNELACFVRERDTHLPPMLKKENMCNRCYAKTSCFIYHKLADDGDGETSGLKQKFDDVVKHLTPKHKDFFLKWDDLLTKEEKECLKFRRELWTMLSSEREKLGRCFSNVIIEPGSAYEEQDNPKINRYRYTMIKQDPPTGFSFIDSQLNVGEPIVISDEKGHFALANGYVTNVRKRRITVAVDRRLHNARIRRPGFDEVNNQVFASIMEVAPEGAIAEDTIGKITEEPVQYRLDKDEFSNGMATVRNNLIQVMAEGPFGSREIRSLVVDLNAPRFKTQATAYTLKDRDTINVDQRRAIQKVMSAEDYALVLGMPGTGKTTTIAHIIRALVSQGKSVLLTSYTHTAVDNILLKLKDDSIPILRLGTIAKIHPDVGEFATLAATTKSSFEDIRSAWHDTPVVATTCLGINHPIFNERTFDYCIVDEASQITLPVCLGPIRLARTFILVGDHNQLPPLVQNEEARTGGLDISLFKLLSDTHPSSVVYLEHQYRMCSDVMALSNNLIYAGRLKCGSQEVANRQITIPNLDALKEHHHTPSTLLRTQRSFCAAPTSSKCWLRNLIDPETKVAFINTDPLLPVSREEAKGNRIVNTTEATIVTQLVSSLLSTGVPASSIGVMTHYRSQLALLKHNLRRHNDVEMHTADRFQGRDKEVIILSLVRSNEARSIGELLKDWRRINVAFTRAKTKLLVVGSKETLKGREDGPGETEMVARFVGLMEERRWVYDLPADALESHYFDDGSSQATGSVATQWKVEDVESKILKEGKKVADVEMKIFDEQRTITESENEKTVLDNKVKVLGVLDSNKENRKPDGLRQPKKTIKGHKPFKPPGPAVSVLGDICNEALH